MSDVNTDVKWLKKITDAFDTRMQSLEGVVGTHYSRLQGALEDVNTALRENEAQGEKDYLTKAEHDIIERNKKNAWKWVVGLLPPYIGLIITIVVLFSKLP